MLRASEGLLEVSVNVLHAEQRHLCKDQQSCKQGAFALIAKLASQGDRSPGPSFPPYISQPGVYLVLRLVFLESTC